jgi:hypothetical protein
LSSWRLGRPALENSMLDLAAFQQIFLIRG